jgi:hypothetical protein
VNATTAAVSVCNGCGQLTGVPEYDAHLRDLYDRLDDGGRRFIEPLVYTGEEFDDSWDDDRETNWAAVAMERNMAERGLCPSCGRPDLTGKTPDDFLSEEDADDLAEMYAEMAAERRAGA